MLPALVSLKSLIKTKSYHIDLPFFRLHYQATVCLLLAFCLILTAKVLFGDTIHCVSRMNGEAHEKFYDNMCYAMGTFTRYKLKPGRHALSRDNSKANATFTVDPTSRYTHSGLLVGDYEHIDPSIRIFWHNYYQYVPVILFIQALLFYMPHYLWKLWENGMISSICKRLHENRFAPNDYFETNYDIIYYIQNIFRLNRSLVYKYYVCHVLCLLNLVVQIIALNMIFNYQFLSFGYVFVKHQLGENIYGLRPFTHRVTDDQQLRNLNNPMDLVFPKVTACNTEFTSEAGKETNKKGFVCVLPLNILHDKFFLILWFWFLLLVVLTAIQIVYDFMFTMLPFFRRHVFSRRYGSSLFDADNRRSSSLPELFLLDLIGHNTDKFAFSALLRKLNKDDWTASPSENQSIV